MFPKKLCFKIPMLQSGGELVNKKAQKLSQNYSYILTMPMQRTEIKCTRVLPHTQRRKCYSHLLMLKIQCTKWEFRKRSFGKIGQHWKENLGGRSKRCTQPKQNYFSTNIKMPACQQQKTRNWPYNTLS